MNAPDIARRFNLHRAGRSWRGRCPACGYADAFKLDLREGRWLGWCAWCRDQAAMRRLMGGINQARDDWTPPPAKSAGIGELRTKNRQDAALRLWMGAVPALDTLAHRYLARRGLSALAASPALRFRADTPHPSGGRYPAMLALIEEGTGKPQALHRTFLAPDGSKGGIEPAKATLGPLAGGIIRLHEAAPELVIGEGIETAASAGVLLGLPAWSAVCGGNLEKLCLPDVVRAVVIAADRDEAGEKAAQAGASRWRDEGRRVRIARPDRPGTDFNDLLRESMEAPHAA